MLFVGPECQQVTSPSPGQGLVHVSEYIRYLVIPPFFHNIRQSLDIKSVLFLRLIKYVS